MSANVHVLPAGLQDGTGVPASSKVSANQRVQTASGTISLISDVFTWPGPSTTGNFIVPMTRVLIDTTPGINATCAGQAINAAGSPVPTVVVTSDPRVSGS
jgi:hypothetical protein